MWRKVSSPLTSYLFRRSQLLCTHPLTLDHLFLTWLEVEGQGVESADKVEVGATEGVGHVMVLSEGQNCSEF